MKIDRIEMLNTIANNVSKKILGMELSRNDIVEILDMMENYKVQLPNDFMDNISERDYEDYSRGVMDSICHEIIYEYDLKFFQKLRNNAIHSIVLDFEKNSDDMPSFFGDKVSKITKNIEHAIDILGTDCFIITNPMVTSVLQCSALNFSPATQSASNSQNCSTKLCGNLMINGTEIPEYCLILNTEEDIVLIGIVGESGEIKSYSIIVENLSFV